ncbi:putative bifunctional diguanylate cyclase/phosphodiesterase [Ammoniphilus resinae]|uniref:Diguanylate cyclase (GGDEF)-like protein/PAS domain S-box-containing protein n=1 Tax=Ammoniphilus resinae TaxID=861532 RepID=A0ABS4GQ05_9BACL|nr:GGDEF and EAL domain-containing protein [Ammoniphilus resinae]MBP1932353.1 diguanylate cyclase (GGDEF)-like protein/PAS domain S-box-containing protein [Ammoniphilus resinae]
MIPHLKEKRIIDSDLLIHLFDQFNQGILIVDLEGRIVSANAMFANLTGYSLSELIGLPFHELQIHKEQIVDCRMPGEKKTKWQGEVQMDRKNGEQRTLWLEIFPVRKNGRVTQFVYLYAQPQTMAYQDSLTRLPNRRCIHDYLNTALATAHDQRQIFAVLYVDLDRFKMVNDTLGHASGDQLLKEAAQRLKSCLRERDMVSRMGGDEFLVLLLDIKGQQEAEEVAKRILASLTNPFFLQDQEVYITASIGISLYPYDGDDRETLITGADAAMYRAKRQGRNLYEWSKPELQAGSFERLILENSLRKAIDQEQLLLHYQPQLDLKSNQILSMEALLRWQHPDLGLIPPGEFIPLAEETGLIQSIGEWVIYSACTQNKAWQNQGLPPVRVAINLSATHLLQKNLPEVVAKILQTTELEPQWLELEITESAIMQDKQTAIQVLDQLKQMGVHLSIDDFGTGYSSLSYLKELPINTLKIDQSFMRDIQENENSRAVTYAIISLAHHLDLSVVAEGVETEQQLDQMREKNCDAIQGFWLSRPVPPEQAEQWMTYTLERGCLE